MEKQAHQLSVAGTFLAVAAMATILVGLIRFVHWVWTW